MGNSKGLFEGILLSILFVVLVSAVLLVFNEKYSQDHDIGLDTSYLNTFEEAIGTAHDETGGEVSQTDTGLSLISSWNIAKGIFDVTWGFVSGAWIHPIVTDMLKMDGTAGKTIVIVGRVLFSALLIFSIIKLFFKTNG